MALTRDYSESYEPLESMPTHEPIREPARHEGERRLSACLDDLRRVDLAERESFTLSAFQR
jgi:hypothetical protein